jgi:hypothetical protein
MNSRVFRKQFMDICRGYGRVPDRHGQLMQIRYHVARRVHARYGGPLMVVDL